VLRLAPAVRLLVVWSLSITEVISADAVTSQRLGCIQRPPQKCGHVVIIARIDSTRRTPHQLSIEMPLGIVTIIFIAIASFLVLFIGAAILCCYIKELLRRRKVRLARKEQHTLPLRAHPPSQEETTREDSTPPPSYATSVGSG